MILGWTAQYSRTPFEMTAADEFGAWVASHDFLEAICDFSQAASIHLFRHPSSIDPQRESQALSRLRARGVSLLPEVYALKDLTGMIGQHEYVFVNQHISFQSFGRLRRAAGAPVVPLCCLVHTISAAPSDYIDALLYGGPHDSVVVTSRAGLHTIRRLFDHTRDFLRQFGWKTDTGGPDIRLIPLGVDTDALRPKDQRSSRELLNIPSDAVVLLHLGRFSEQEKADLEPLLTLLDVLLKDGLPVHLVLAGQDRGREYSSQLERMAQERGLWDTVTILANFPAFLKASILSAADIFVAVSDNIQETFGIALVEAMACGLPVIAADWNGYRDLVVPGETGYRVPTYWSSDAGQHASEMQTVWQPRELRHYLAQRTVVDPLALYEIARRLAGDANLRRELGANGRCRAEREFTWEVIVGAYDQLWTEQRKVASSLEPTLPDLGSYDFNKLFEHFATATAGESVRLRLVGGIEKNRAPSSLLTEQLRRRGEMSIAELRAFGGQDAVDWAIRLWKKGGIRLVDSNES